MRADAKTWWAGAEAGEKTSWGSVFGSVGGHGDWRGGFAAELVAGVRW